MEIFAFDFSEISVLIMDIYQMCWLDINNSANMDRSLYLFCIFVSSFLYTAGKTKIDLNYRLGLAESASQKKLTRVVQVLPIKYMDVGITIFAYICPF